MFGKLFKFERQLQFQQVSFWVVMLLMFIVGFAIIAVDWFVVSFEGGERVKVNGAYTLSNQISFLSFLAIFFASVFVVTGMMRDEIHKTVELIHTTPVKNLELVLPRFMGAWLATFLCVSAAVLGIFIGQFMPWVDKESLGPVRLSYFLYPTFTFVFINSFIFSAIYALIASWTRRKMLVYVSAIGLLVFYFVGLTMAADAPKWLVSMIDPVGVIPLSQEVQYWPASERNTELVSLFGKLGGNRVLWSSIALGLLLLTYRLFKRGTMIKETKAVVTTDVSETYAPYESVQPRFGLSGQYKALFSRIKTDYVGSVRSISFYVLCGIALALISITLVQEMMFDTDPRYPTSRRMANLAVGGFALPALLVTIFFSGELFWRERTAKFNEIIDATPVRNWQMLLGKWVSLSLIIMTMFAFSMIVAIFCQILMGSLNINLATYFSIIFVSFCAPFVITSGLALFVQNFMPNRIVGMFAAGAVLIAIGFAVPQLPFFHPLMSIGEFSAGRYSEMNGFERAQDYNWFSIYNLMITGLLALISVWFWRRGLQTSLLNRFRNLKSAVTLPSIVIGVGLLLGAVFTGNKIFSSYETVDYKNEKAREKELVAYEKMFADEYDAPLPKVRSVKVEANIQPKTGEGLFSGEYIIENVTGEPLKDLIINIPTSHKEDVKKLVITGASRNRDRENIEILEDSRHQVFTFDRPVPAGEKFQLEFEMYFHPPRLVDYSQILGNGTFVNNSQVFPMLGIQQRRMRNPDDRRKYDLPELPKKPDQTDLEARQFNFFMRTADYVDFKARVCTDPGQIPIAPGKHIGTEDIQIDGVDRHCRSYEAINPIMNFFAFMSADYEVSRDVWDNSDGENVDLAIYYHADHDYNIDLMMDAAKSSLDTFTDTFGPYQYSQVRIMEFPYGNFAQAFAGTVPFSENIGFVRDPGDADDAKSIDIASYVTMHEIGHQWFGHQIVPGETKGFNVLSEGLTENAALTAYEAKFGWNRARRMLEERTIRRYLSGRANDNDDEPALINADSQGYLNYNKSSWVFWGLKQYMGEAEMQSAIRGFLEEYGSKGPPYPTTHQLVEYLRNAAPEDYQQLITDYWERITLWEMSIDDVKVTGSEDNYTIGFTVKVDKKIASEETGKETSVTEIEEESLNEWVEIGFYDKDPKETLGGDWIKLERVRITELETEMSFSFTEKPTHVLIDPRRLLIERNVDDNVQKIGKLESTEG